MPPSSRGAIALRIGKEISNAGSSILKMPPDSGLTHRTELYRSCLARLIILDRDLANLVEGCQAAKGQYLNYPLVRNALVAAGDELYIRLQELRRIFIILQDRIEMQPEANFSDLAKQLITLGQVIRLTSFTPARAEA